MPTLVVCIDGLGKELLRRRWEEGWMGCLRGLAERGEMRELEVPEGGEARVNWITAFTGVYADQHGVCCARELDGKGWIQRRTCAQLEANPWNL